MFNALSANFLDFSPTLAAESLRAGVEGRLLRIPFIGVGLRSERLELSIKKH